jgi:FtsH-binding integral membrane protein
VDHTNNSSLLENSAAIVLGAIVLLYMIYIVIEIFFEERRVRGARILSIISTLIVILSFSTLACYLQNDAAMTTAMATMILVVIAGFYAWNTHIQVGSWTKRRT